MITKELLSLVLNVEILNIIEQSKADLLVDTLRYESSNMFERYEEINVHVLANKCKEWAILNGIQISSEMELNKKGVAIFSWNEDMGYCRFDFLRKHTYDSERFTAESEHEAIIEACEYILNRDKKCSK